MENLHYEQIPAYLNSTLTEEQRRAFEAELERDPDLRLAVEEYPSVIEALDAAAEDDAKDLVAKIRKSDNSVSPAPTAQITPMRRPWLVAASILVLAIAGTITFVNVNYSTAALISASYHAPADLGQLKSEGQASTDWDAVMRAWREGNQAAALNLADVFLLQHPGDVDVIRRVAHLHFRAGDFDQALMHYNSIRDDQDDRQYGDYADFHYALTLIQLGRETEAQEVLDTISGTEDHRFREDAARLRSRLSSIWHRMAFD